MKQLLPMLLLLFLSGILHAQESNSDKIKANEVAAYRELVARYREQTKEKADTVDITKPKAYLVNPTPGIHRLPQDNMPCIVPDLRATVAIPNTWGETQVPFKGKSPRVPNPAKPFKLSPSRPLLLHPENDSKTK